MMWYSYSPYEVPSEGAIGRLPLKNDHAKSHAFLVSQFNWVRLEAHYMLNAIISCYPGTIHLSNLTLPFCQGTWIQRNLSTQPSPYQSPRMPGMDVATWGIHKQVAILGSCWKTWLQKTALKNLRLALANAHCDREPWRNMETLWFKYV